jgi:acid phosphatase (class A)
LAWRPDFFARIVLAEFGHTDWQTIRVNPPPSARKKIFKEIDYLVGPAMRRRDDLWDEILDQDGRIVGWFAQTLMLSPSAHPYTIMILEMASQVGQMVALYFKRRFNRARPQQVFPGLIPMLVSPWHASYPSGHSLESHLIALALGQIVPGASEALNALATRLGTNREVAGVHYPSDTQTGAMIAYKAFDRLQKCKTYRDVRKLAKAEYK